MLKIVIPIEESTVILTISSISLLKDTHLKKKIKIKDTHLILRFVKTYYKALLMYNPEVVIYYSRWLIRSPVSL